MSLPMFRRLPRMETASEFWALLTETTCSPRLVAFTENNSQPLRRSTEYSILLTTLPTSIVLQRAVPVILTDDKLHCPPKFQL